MSGTVQGAFSKTLCRDCLARYASSVSRCRACGSPRVVQHGELFELAIAHIDCDAFYAAIEKRDDPSLADRAVIIGGGKRGVVATCCYIARIKGVRSAMPMFKARQLCPEAVVIRPDMAKYAAVGRDVRAMMLELTPAVEPLSIDEAFLDLSGTERLHHAPPAAVLAAFAQRVEKEIGISVSVGLSHNKFLAKIASDLDKPRGFSVLGRTETMAFLARQKVSVIWGVGAAMQRRLEKDGIATIGQIQGMEESTLARRYGAMGLRLAQLSQGQDARPVKSEREAKSISAETTFESDLALESELMPVLRRLSEKVSSRLKEKTLAGQTIVLKLKTSDFRTLTRSRALSDPTSLADKIFRNGRELLLKELGGSSYRLLGIGVSELQDAARADPLDLLDPEADRRAQVEHAIDRIRAKFGAHGVDFGLTFEAGKPKKREDDTRV
ncbi:DNA polymerase IV [Rhodopseudomonas julia]|uniref:DNA polymerase IV n=1 Tax=Rhodopseudomonas julia TaxID=200617 RepID=UPI0027D898A4|nr:DNA polymerase IV [Rhodopseudomonas julia]